MEGGVLALVIVLSVLLALFVCLCVGERWSKLKMKAKYKQELEEARLDVRKHTRDKLSPPRETPTPSPAQGVQVAGPKHVGNPKGRGRGSKQLQVKTPISKPSKPTGLLKTIINKIKKSSTPYDKNETIRLGSNVEIHGLLARHDMNGLKGEVVEVGEAGRTHVVEVDGKKIRFPRQNLRLYGDDVPSSVIDMTKCDNDNQPEEGNNNNTNNNNGIQNPLDALVPSSLPPPPAPPTDTDIISTKAGSIHDDKLSTNADLPEQPFRVDVNKITTPIQTPVMAPPLVGDEEDDKQQQQQQQEEEEGEPASKRDVLTAGSVKVSDVKPPPRSPPLDAMLAQAAVAGIVDEGFQQLPSPPTITTTPTAPPDKNTIALTPSQLLKPGRVMHTVRDEPSSPPNINSNTS